MADAKRQPRLGAPQRLALRFFVAAQHQRLVRRIEIKTNDVSELLLEVCIVGELEGSLQMRLDVIGSPQALHAGCRDARGFRHAAATLAPSGRRRSRYRVQHIFDRHSQQRGLAPPARRVGKSCQPLSGKAPTPVTDRHARHPNFCCDLLLRQATGRQQDDLRAPSIPHRHGFRAQTLRQFPFSSAFSTIRALLISPSAKIAVLAV